MESNLTIQETKLTIRERSSLIVALLSNQINCDLSALGSEERDPGGNPDASDERISDLRTRIGALRNLREQVEHVFSGVSVAGQ